ncbi:MAG: TetR/AcrR family transcriptional regulator [Thermoclostridium sp.]|nr:TetR/AcrR family transcriptional regulator [Thermoclostridium sp.]
MSDLPIREPKQKRSIEKKTKIVKAGMDLFCEKGYHGTNTVEIAERAGVSTGTVYCYFKDKKDIYIASFEYFLDSYHRPLLDELNNLPKPVDTKVLIDKCIDLLIDLYANSRKTVHDLGLMQESEPEIMQYFAAYEDKVFSSLVKVFDTSTITKSDLHEKIYLLYTLADILGQEHAFHYHKSINLDILRQQITNMLHHLFTQKE